MQTQFLKVFKTLTLPTIEHVNLFIFTLDDKAFFQC